MPTKRIIVLANSIKKSARCVAGVDVGTENTLVPPKWIRPVSGESEGELEPRHMGTSDGAPLAPLDIVDVPLSEYANDAIHPEDWIVDRSQEWTRAGELNRTRLDSLEENPNDLWLEPSVGSDRVTSAFLLKRPQHQSLYLIRPEDFRVELSVMQYHDKPHPSTRRRARFSYGGHNYEMNLTDPVFTDTYCGALPAVGEPAVTVHPPHGDKCLLCVSLTPLYRDYHWKIVATILELP